MLDVADRQHFASTVAVTHGGVKYLFNNAGVALEPRIDAASYEGMHWLMNINCWGVVHRFTDVLAQELKTPPVNVSCTFSRRDETQYR